MKVTPTSGLWRWPTNRPFSTKGWWEGKARCVKHIQKSLPLRITLNARFTSQISENAYSMAYSMPFRVCNQLSESFESEKKHCSSLFYIPSSVPPSLIQGTMNIKIRRKTKAQSNGLAEPIMPLCDVFCLKGSMLQP